MATRRAARSPALVAFLALAGCAPVDGDLASAPADAAYDLVIRGGALYDGQGSGPTTADLAIRGDAIAHVGRVEGAGRIEIDATGLAVAPGFINMLSSGWDLLIEDGRAQSDLRQGVTTLVSGEGWSLGPWNEEMKAEAQERQWEQLRYDVPWTTLDEALEFFAAHGVATNLTSLVGATTVRRHILGDADRSPSPEELEEMRELVRSAMRDGALGLGSSLIYAPGFYASTEELIALASVAAEYDGIYVSHLRSEGNRLVEAVGEFLRIVREAGARGEIYHLKAAGAANWPKLEVVIRRLQAAREEGLEVSANVYPYTAAQSSFAAMMPPWVQEGGHEAWIARLSNPVARARIVRDMTTPSDEWENFFLLAGSPDRIVPVAFQSEALRPLSGRTLAAIAAERGRPPVETILDLTIEDDSRIQAMYHLMSEANVRRKLTLPWVSFGSDQAPFARDSAFAQKATHPRAYGTFARVLGHYARELELELGELIRRMTSLPAENLRLDRRGRLREGYFADVVVFDPQRIRDHASYTDSHRYASGVRHVLVNGVLVLSAGEPTGRPAGRVLRRRGR